MKWVVAIIVVEIVRLFSNSGEKENWLLILISKQTSQYENLIKQKTKIQQKYKQCQNIDMTVLTDD